ncbi:MAG: hypothetical protein A4E34_01462 [Methanoregula sp. PtaU1.Bin006]|nr:MAG: hypothetical protein A4E33_02506 [Methanoregula sp. PtaB.Bin085]OPY34417.1 MAG: hypothetical protein A4E34_01462 [Methanoregula sp. PtaU1.Bin006]
MLNETYNEAGIQPGNTTGAVKSRIARSESNCHRPSHGYGGKNTRIDVRDGATHIREWKKPPLEKIKYKNIRDQGQKYTDFI